MTSPEAERFTLHQTLRGLMPEAVADTLMAHLPPIGWSNIATKDDIDILRSEMNHGFGLINARFERVDETLTHIEARFTQIDERFKQIDARPANFETRFDRLETKIDQLASMKRYVITTGISLAAIMCGVVAPLWFSLP
ncbi:MAG: hypothetical protein RLZZ538_481 [Actinomycetota bacterium]|nr:hypothetical protein [Ilumatobacteraceae bacterium]